MQPIRSILFIDAGVVTQGWFMWFFERCDNEDDFGHHMKTPIYEQIW